MSCFGKKTEDDIINEQIQVEIKKEQKKTRYKILLLGTGDSGKTTFVKQMKRNFGKGFQDNEKEAFADVLRDNCLTGMRLLVDAYIQSFSPSVSDSSDSTSTRPESDHALKNLMSEVTAVQQAESLTPEVAKAVKALWKQQDLQDYWSTNEHILQLPGGRGGSQYFFQKADVFANPSFKPSDDEICMARRKTTGILEFMFEFDGVEFLIVDVGGQRGERKKWLGCFGGIDLVIFLSAINEFDMKLEETDNNINRQKESLSLFRNMSKANWFRGKDFEKQDTSRPPTPFILFLNKTDLFREKIKRKPLNAEIYKTTVATLPKWLGTLEQFNLSKKYAKSLAENVSVSTTEDYEGSKEGSKHVSPPVSPTSTSASTTASTTASTAPGVSTPNSSAKPGGALPRSFTSTSPAEDGSTPRDKPGGESPNPKRLVGQEDSDRKSTKKEKKGKGDRETVSEDGDDYTSVSNWFMDKDEEYVKGIYFMRTLFLKEWNTALDDNKTSTEGAEIFDSVREDQPLYIYPTNALDTKLCRKIFATVKDIMTRKQLDTIM